ISRRTGIVQHSHLRVVDRHNGNINPSIAVEIAKVEANRNAHRYKAFRCGERERIARTCILQYGYTRAEQEGGCDIRLTVAVEITDADVLYRCGQGNRRYRRETQCSGCAVVGDNEQVTEVCLILSGYNFRSAVAVEVADSQPIRCSCIWNSDDIGSCSK